MGIQIHTAPFPDGKFTIATDELSQVVEPQAGKQLLRHVLNPGWNWARVIGADKGLKYNPKPHFGVCVQGECRVTLNDAKETKIDPRPATVKTIKAGDAFVIPPDHNAESVGDKPLIFYELPDCSGIAKDLTKLQIYSFDEPHTESTKRGKFSARKMSLGASGNQAIMQVTLHKGFVWSKDMSPALPGHPTHCDQPHFGFVERGAIDVTMRDGSRKLIKEGEAYIIPPGHDSDVTEETVIYEFNAATAKAYATNLLSGKGCEHTVNEPPHAQGNGNAKIIQTNNGPLGIANVGHAADSAANTFTGFFKGLF